MPGGDGTGPLGLGPRTGWGRGPCMAGRGRGFRGRRFWRRRFWDPYTCEDYEPIKDELKEEIKALESELKRMQEKLKNFEIEE